MSCSLTRSGASDLVGTGVAKQLHLHLGPLACGGVSVCFPLSALQDTHFDKQPNEMKSDCIHYNLMSVVVLQAAVFSIYYYLRRVHICAMSSCTIW